MLLPRSTTHRNLHGHLPSLSSYIISPRYPDAPVVSGFPVLRSSQRARSLPISSTRIGAPRTLPRKPIRFTIDAHPGDSCLAIYYAIYAALVNTDNLDIGCPRTFATCTELTPCGVNADELVTV